MRRKQKLDLKLTSPTIGGHQPVKIGKTTFGVTRGSRVAHVTRKGRRMAYILDLSGTVHVFVEGGEVAGIGTALQTMIKKQVFGVT